MEADNFEDGPHKPTFHEDGLQAVVKFGDNFKDALHKPTFMRMAYMRHWRPAISRMVFTSPPSSEGLQAEDLFNGKAPDRGIKPQGMWRMVLPRRQLSSVVKVIRACCCSI